MSEELSKIIDGLIAQNYKLGHKQLAMQCICSAMIAQIALLSHEQRDALDRFNSELSGTAMGIAAGFQTSGMAPEYVTEAITATVETIAVLSEKCLASQRLPAVVPVCS